MTTGPRPHPAFSGGPAVAGPLAARGQAGRARWRRRRKDGSNQLEGIATRGAGGRMDRGSFHKTDRNLIGCRTPSLPSFSSSLTVYLRLPGWTVLRRGFSAHPPPARTETYPVGAGLYGPVAHPHSAARSIIKQSSGPQKESGTRRNWGLRMGLCGSIFRKWPGIWNIFSPRASIPPRYRAA